jgi:UDP-N-acetylmuramoylalanine--D-glutamate ligase
MATDAIASRVLIVGLGVTGEALVRRLGADRVVVVDDRPDDSSRARARSLGVELLEGPDRQSLRALVADASMVVPSPGVRAGHAVYELAAETGTELVSEVELAYRESAVPIVAVTGTNGKTSVTTMVAAMLVAAGRRAIAAGNIGLPLIAAVGDDVDVIVAEVSSFQLQYTSTFRPVVATWLNFAQDHLDWHPTMDDYAAAKAKVFANQMSDDVAVANADDPIVMDAAQRGRARLVTFGRAGDYRIENGVLQAWDGSPIAAVDELPRHLPYELANALAASATAMAAGASVADCRSVLTSFTGLPHRVALIGDARGVRYYDDSKATTPASVLAALEGFESVVLIAGGRNKGLDLGVLSQAAGRVRAVVAIGDAAPEVAAAFDSACPVTVAQSMDAAVDAAASLAQPGDAVLLSPGCASFDWYRSYGERGDDFARAVRERVLV